jgi:uncharacterized protein DUF1259
LAQPPARSSKVEQAAWRYSDHDLWFTPGVKHRPINPIEENAIMRTRTSVLIFILALAFIGEANAGEIDWPKVDAALGKSASGQGEVHRYGIPRSDLQVTLDGVAIKPALALGQQGCVPGSKSGAVSRRKLSTFAARS